MAMLAALLKDYHKAEEAPRTSLAALLKAYNEDQPRDELGRFSEADVRATAEVDPDGYGKHDEDTDSYAGVTAAQWNSWAYSSDNINDALNGDLKIGSVSTADGHRLNSNEVSELSDTGERIQAAAAANYVENVALFRGESYSSMEEAKAKYFHNNVVTSDRMLSTATDPEAAALYANSGGMDDDPNSVRVLISYSQRGGVQGIQTSPFGEPSNEVVMPKGASFRVLGKPTVRGNVMIVEMYQKEEPSGNGVKLREGGSGYGGKIRMLEAMGVTEKASLVGLLRKNLDQHAHSAATSPLNLRAAPTEGQRTAGNYKKGHVRFAGLNIAIENPAGSRRKAEWPEMNAHYGYIKGTRGADGDPLDVFVRPSTPLDWDGAAYVIEQLNAEGTFDEHKIMLGYEDMGQAVRSYMSHFPRGWKLGPVSTMTVGELKLWMKEYGHEETDTQPE